MPRGGKRPGAGQKPRHVVPMVTVTIRLTPGQAKRLKELGGGEWVRNQLGPVESPEPGDQLQLPLPKD